MRDLGFIGIGNMGLPMTGRLLERGYRVTVFDTVAARVQAAVACGRRRRMRAALHALIVGLVLAGGVVDVSGGGFAGQFLVATEEIRDPRFERAVIYLVHHDEAGAMGLIVNQPLGALPLARVLDSFGLDPEGVRGDIMVHYGGPVQPTRGFVLHTSEYSDPSTEAVAGGIALTADRAILDAIAHGHGPREALFALGYAGWAGGQLEAEIRAGGWITVPADRGLLFDADAGRKWERAMARRKIQL
jgi:putative transcriptional regulator